MTHSHKPAAPLRVGIVGAGIAGASCAGALAAAGWQVDVFEAAAEAGGRLATHRSAQGWAALGSPFIVAKRDPFRSQLRDWARQGWLAPVRGDVLKGRAMVTWTQAQLQNHYQPLVEPTHLVQHLLGGARLHLQSPVAALRPRTVVLQNGQTLSHYDCVVCSVPAPQALPMLDALPLLQQRLHAVRMRPQWSFLMRWQGGPSANVIQFGDARLEMAVRQPSAGEGLWLVTSSHAFTETGGAETGRDLSEQEAGARAASALTALLGLPSPVGVEAARLWQHAMPDATVGGFWLGDRENRVALIGDSIAGAGIERAWESGVRMAQALVQSRQELANCLTDAVPELVTS